MIDPTKLAETASNLIGDGTDPERAAKGAELLKVAAKISKQQAETSKLQSEGRKLEADILVKPRRARADNQRHIISQLIPLCTVLVLAGTLILQTFQYIGSERERREEVQRQQDAALDARWAQAVKAVSGPDKLAASISLKAFLQSKYSGDARQLAYQVLLQTEDQQIFEDLFVSAFQPLGWSNLPLVAQLDRAISARDNALLDKLNKHQELTASEQHQYDFDQTAVPYICGQLATLLRGPRRPNVPVDLSSVQIWDCDFSNVNLRGANVTGFLPTRVRWSGADLRVTAFGSHELWGFNAWWQAARIRPDLLKYLASNFAYQAGVNYGAVETSKKEYIKALERLSSANKTPPHPGKS